MRLPLVLALAVALSSHAWAVGLAPEVVQAPADALSRAAGVAFGLLCLVLLFCVAKDWLAKRREFGVLMHAAAAAFALLLICLGSAAWAIDSDGTRPDDKLTPGEVRTVDRAEICGTKTGTVRNVPDVMKIAARRNYGLMNNRAGWCAPNGCEIDHRVPLEIGGGNTRGSIANLWPEKATGPNNFHDKDRCENATHRAICNGSMSVESAQAIFLGDWVAGCAALMGAK